MRLWIKGDCHGNYDWVSTFCEINDTTKEDIIIIAGDAGLRFTGSRKEKNTCIFLSEQPITFLVVRGNHDKRPEDCDFIKTWNDKVHGRVFVDSIAENILYALDGEEYLINNKSILTIGGAYSVDKYYRQMMRWTWFANEELSAGEMQLIMDKIEGHSYDLVVTHTCPYTNIPTELFMSSIDQSKVSKAMEIFLERVKDKINYKAWIFGHYHADKIISHLDKMAILMDEIIEIRDVDDMWDDIIKQFRSFFTFQ